MTLTEAAAVAVAAASAAGRLYEGISFDDVGEALTRTTTLTGSIFMILVAVAALGHLAALERLPQAIASTVTEMGLGPLEFMLVINVIFIIGGMI